MQAHDRAHRDAVERRGVRGKLAGIFRIASRERLAHDADDRLGVLRIEPDVAVFAACIVIMIAMFIATGVGVFLAMRMRVRFERPAVPLIEKGNARRMRQASQQ